MLAESTIYKLDAVSDVANDMAQNVETEEKKDESKTCEFVRILNDNVCKKCENYEKCWKNNYHAMYETVFNALEILNETGEILEDKIQNGNCINKKLFAEGINFSYEIYKVNKEWRSKVNENKILVAKQLRGVSKAIENVKEELREEAKSEKLLGTGLRMEVGIASSKKKNSNVSGDSTVFSKLNDGRVLLALSDGMGSGESAKKASKKVLELFEKYLNAGLDRNIALDLVNSYMLLGENNENFATLDAIIFNPTNARVEIIKFGAPPTFIKRFGDVKLISSKSLPVGADTKFVFEVFEDTLESGDTIAIVSDGVSDAKAERESWIKNSFSQIKKSDSKRTADIILGEAMDENLGINKDDMTVIIAKIK